MSLVDHIKQEEGFEGKPYIDTKGFLTIGYGTKLPLTKKEAELLLNYRLNKLQAEVRGTLHDLKASDEVWDILFHMAYQLGANGLFKFKKMISALYKLDYNKAADEGLDSLWAVQTPNRANRLMEQLRNIKV